MRKGARKPLHWVLAASALLVAAAVSFLYVDYATSVRGHKRLLVERGEALLDSLEAGMRAQGKVALLRGDRIPILFEETARIRGVKGVRLATVQGATVVEFGAAKGLDVAAPGKALWLDSLLVQASTLKLSQEFPHSEGGGRRGWGGGVDANNHPMPEGPYVISLALDATPLHSDLWYETARFGVSAAIAVGAVLLAAGLLLLEFRRLALQADLNLAREAAAEHERLAQLGAGLAHETKNPLNLVRGLAQDIATTSSLSPEAHDKASLIVDEVDRTVGQINSFLEISRPKEARLEPVRLDLLLNEIAAVLQPEARDKGVSLEAVSTEEKIMADRDLLRRAVLNLLINGIRACRAGGHVRLEVERKDAGIALCVADDGCGIAPEDLPRVTEPYFTRFEGGTGLGLVIVQQIARLHGATLKVDSRVGEGTRVSLTGLRAVD